MSRSAKKTSTDLMDATIGIRRSMIRDRVRYEPGYYTSRLDPHDSKHKKLYLMTIGRPGRRNTDLPVARKVLTARVGLSSQSSFERVQEHNRPGDQHVDPLTKHGAGHWVLCMALYVPKTLERYTSTKVLRDFWRTAHGGGKIRCGIMLHRYLGLHCTVTEEAMDAARQQAPKVVLPEPEYYEFKPEGVENANQNLVISNKL